MLASVFLLAPLTLGSQTVDVNDPCVQWGIANPAINNCNDNTCIANYFGTVASKCTGAYDTCYYNCEAAFYRCAANTASCNQGIQTCDSCNPGVTSCLAACDSGSTTPPKTPPTTGSTCPSIYPIDCGNDWCCPTGSTCGTGQTCHSTTTTPSCPSQNPVECPDNWCCPTGSVCGGGQTCQWATTSTSSTTTTSSSSTATSTATSFILSQDQLNYQWTQGVQDSIIVIAEDSSDGFKAVPGVTVTCTAFDSVLCIDNLGQADPNHQFSSESGTQVTGWDGGATFTSIYKGTNTQVSVHCVGVMPNGFTSDICVSININPKQTSTTSSSTSTPKPSTVGHSTSAESRPLANSLLGLVVLIPMLFL